MTFDISTLDYRIVLLMTQSSICGYVFHHSSDTTFSHFSLKSKERLTLGAGALVPGFRHTRVLYLHHGSWNDTLCSVEPGLVLRKKGEQEVIGEPRRGLKGSAAWRRSFDAADLPSANKPATIQLSWPIQTFPCLNALPRGRVLVCARRWCRAKCSENVTVSPLPCLVPRRLSFDENVRAKEGGKETTGKALRLPPYTLLKVPCGSSPVTRVSRSPLPWEKRSAWGGGCIPPIFASVVRLFSIRRLVPINRVQCRIVQPLRKFDF